MPSSPWVSGWPARPRPELVRRFVDATIVSWVNYLCGDRKAANAPMLRDNPELSEDGTERSVALMKTLGIVDSGESLAKGIGAMSPERIRDFHAQMVKAGLYKAGEVDLAKVAEFGFVNRGGWASTASENCRTRRPRAAGSSPRAPIRHGPDGPRARSMVTLSVTGPWADRETRQ